MNQDRASDWELLTFDDSEALASGVADRLIEHLASPSDSPSVALSGGRITRKLFAALASRDQAAASLRSCDYFWADERCVPLDHPESNYRLADTLLFRPLEIDRKQQHPFVGGEEPRRMAEMGRTMLQEFFERQSGQTPVLDLILLGMGEDGHTASLFPENMAEDLRRSDACHEVTARKPPPHRVTLSYAVLAAAAEVWLIVSGEGKASKLEQALARSESTPTGKVLASRAFTRIFTDLGVQSASRGKGGSDQRQDTDH